MNLWLLVCRTNFAPFENDFTGDQSGARDTVPVVEQDRRQHIESFETAYRRQLTRLVSPVQAPSLGSEYRFPSPSLASRPFSELDACCQEKAPQNKNSASSPVGLFALRATPRPRSSSMMPGVQTQQILKGFIPKFTHGRPASGSSSRLDSARLTIIPSPDTSYGTRGATGTARRARTSSYTGIPSPASTRHRHAVAGYSGPAPRLAPGSTPATPHARRQRMPLRCHLRTSRGRPCPAGPNSSRADPPTDPPQRQARASLARSPPVSPADRPDADE